ncbi:MAG TPA: fatty acid desaturase [Candidatus Poseidoniales archaeon]|nr:fatty acid desaturase [Candidatus Poseidoniales archaeon]
MGDVVDDFSNDFAGIGNEEDGGVSQNYRSDGTISWPTTLFITLTPIFAIVGAVGHTLIFGISWIDLVTLLVFYLIIGMSVTAGYHRCFAHRAYEARWPLRLGYAIMGAAAVEHSAIVWSATHRTHHKFSDKEGDPHSSKKGMYWAHMGWMFINEKPPLAKVPDLMEDPILRWQNRHIWKITFLAAFGLPILVGAVIGALTPTRGDILARTLGCFIWAGLVRIVLIHHTTWLINSAAHGFGRQPYTSEDGSKDNELVAIFTLGEGYHNFHHAFQGDYRNGVRWWQYDPTKWWIKFNTFIGMTHSLKRAPTRAIQTARADQRWRKLMGRRTLGMRAKEKFEVRYTELRERMREAMTRMAKKSAESKALRREKFRAAKRELNEVKTRLAELMKEVRALSKKPAATA